MDQAQPFPQMLVAEMVAPAMPECLLVDLGIPDLNGAYRLCEHQGYLIWCHEKQNYILFSTREGRWMFSGKAAMSEEEGSVRSGEFHEGKSPHLMPSGSWESWSPLPFIGGWLTAPFITVHVAPESEVTSEIAAEAVILPNDAEEKQVAAKKSPEHNAASERGAGSPISGQWWKTIFAAEWDAGITAEEEVLPERKSSFRRAVQQEGWWAPYRHTAMSAIRNAIVKGAEHVALIGVRSDADLGEATAEEWPAMLQELRDAYCERKEPFFANGGKSKQLDWNALDEIRTSVDRLEDKLMEVTNSPTKRAIIISCNEHEMHGAAAIVQRHNRKTDYSEVDVAWATKDDVYY